MDWVQVVALGVSGALGVLVARLIVRKPKENKKSQILYMVIVLVALSAFNWLLREFVLPDIRNWTAASRLESTALEQPVFQAISQYEPETYEKIITSVKTAVSEGATEDDVRRITQGYLAPLVQSRIPSASNEAVIRYMRVTVAEIRELHALPGDLGYRFLFPGEDGPVNPQYYLSKEVLDEDLAAMAEVVRSSATAPQAMPDETIVTPLIGSAFDAVAEEYGEDIWMLENPTAPDVDKSLVTLMVVSLYENILSLPESEAGMVLRYMLAL